MNAQITISKWGESLGIRIPKKVATQMQLKEGNKIQMEFDAGQLILKPQISIDWLMQGMTEENRHDLLLDDKPVGKEIW